ncbi:MAG: glycosyltransferase family 39 protein [Alphaproteobacteria bacterium]|nr:glycosyltransferase family 39 protein [Alphaproteobacteria bacterium]
MAASDTKALSGSDNETLRYQRIAAFTLLGVTLVRLLWLSSNPIDLYPDEAQYWLWSRTPALGYVTKPPLLAWLITVTTSVFGEDEFAIRVASPLLHFLTGFVVWGIAKRLYDARIACWSAVVYITLPAVSLSAAIISTDVPLLLCWAVALYGFIRAREAPREATGPSPDASARRWWIVVGIAAGLGLLAKYAMAYWLISALLFVLLFREERRHLPALLGATALGLLVYLPNFFWNLSHGFASYKHTKANADLSGPLFHPNQFLEFFTSQFGVFGPILFGALVVLVLVFPRQLADRRARLLAIFALPSLAMMLVVSFLSRAHANWSAPTYVSATILVVAWLIEHRRTALLGASVAIHVLAAVLLVGAKSAAATLHVPLPAKYDLLRRVRGWHPLGEQVSQMLLRRPGTILLSDSREALAALVYYVRPHPFDAVIWNPEGGARNQFELETDMSHLVGRDFLFVTQSEISPFMAGKFAAVSPPTRITIILGPGDKPGEPPLERHYFVYDLDGFKGYR